MKNISVLIMAGGSGERFWPLSTKERPKQLLKLIDEQRSLIRMTVDRVLPIVPPERIFVATNSVQAKAVYEELPMITNENIILEPAFKDTAAAIGFGSIIINRKYPDSTLIVLASDHLIKNEPDFRSCLSTAIEVANANNSIVTLGIKPDKPETGYGYLETTECYIGEPTRVMNFCEKPALETAVKYVTDGRFLWNSGIFIFRISTILKAFELLLPKHYNILTQISQLGDSMLDCTNSELIKLFETFEKISIDFGIMEKFDNTMVIPVDFGWSDIGSFPALAEVFTPNENSTVLKGTSLKEICSSRNIVMSTTGRKISLLGANDLVIVDTPDNLLICSKAEAQNIKKLL